ncbi:pyruvate formate lyase activating enzyme [Parabacteroides sp. PF5-5]|uniref:glycyl-radical enzyme activating protein n=1 Tax=unclassified Parabacteroides TaxID=2649774 RepID=UPI00247443DF|nr:MULTISPECIES: glycyl-radical enzyme activating protein [unclassified Parabacteroides]MDH6304373.1 pyruvate formate lyase activating enzyme [Parabacteroides sp. PH5-39]MDH6315474.1 pyruvate formate lyase activating enzyme [Parabacteroides sp. PF5-13]MDH6319032.1 pyruvate formate lyase activating enzyme [Parabacteroides sp. PH5-13]MDH6322762.1 pyruvate formate lyase activating enzyme [Parabacteroides sp. PH5-8]MDH6334364.1 pyruvate formate lyase activating enzyme [Parabacteroides sp. PF5-5]
MSLFFDIKRYSINDGPGIRITLFMKGCPLSCLWCHNPEGISAKKEKMYTRKKCISCRTCVEKCPQQALFLTPDGIKTHPGKCTLCGTCTNVCPTKAMEISGTEYTIDYLMNEIEKETIFMDRSEGGVTFCGGEPLMHPETLLELLRRCGKMGIHRVIDTTLFARPEVVTPIMEETDLFLVDLKHMDSAKHRFFCGVPNELILSNLCMITDAGKEVSIRIPLIEGVNADEENISRSAEFLSTLAWNPKTVHLLPYHDIAKGKHEKLGTTYNPANVPMDPPSEEVQQRCINIFHSHNIQTIIGG